MTAVWKSRHDDLVSDGVVAPHAFDPMVVPDCGVVLTRCNSIKCAVDAGLDAACRLTEFVADRRLIIWRQTLETFLDYSMR